MSKPPENTILRHDDRVVIGLGWNRKRSQGQEHDLDLALAFVGADGKCASTGDLCFYQKGHKTIHGGAAIHHGDERIGAAEGDDERIDLALSLVPPSVDRIVAIGSIYEADADGLTFGTVDGAYIRIATAGGRQIASCDLSEDASLASAIEFCELARMPHGWQVQVVNRASASGFSAVVARYGFTGR